MNRRIRNRKHAAETRRRKKESMSKLLDELNQLRKVCMCGQTFGFGSVQRIRPNVPERVMHDRRNVSTTTSLPSRWLPMAPNGSCS